MLWNHLTITITLLLYLLFLLSLILKYKWSLSLVLFRVILFLGYFLYYFLGILICLCFNFSYEFYVPNYYYLTEQSITRSFLYFFFFNPGSMAAAIVIRLKNFKNNSKLSFYELIRFIFKNLLLFMFSLVFNFAYFYYQLLVLILKAIITKRGRLEYLTSCSKFSVKQVSNQQGATPFRIFMVKGRKLRTMPIK